MNNSLEIYTEDVGVVVNALTRAGYYVRVWQDGESDTISVINYVHPKYDGLKFIVGDA